MSTNLIQKNLWKKLHSKKYRHSFVASQIGATVAAQIASTRVARGWTQKRLAEKAEMSQVRISVLEDPSYENFSIKTLKRLAEALNVALIVKFAPFSEMLAWLSGLRPNALAVPKFEDDALPIALEDAQSLPAAMQSRGLGERRESHAAADAATKSSRRPEALFLRGIDLTPPFVVPDRPQPMVLGGRP